MRKTAQASIQETIEMLRRLSSSPDQMAVISSIVDACVTALNTGNKLLFMGNGGSAADAQHLAAELVSRFEFNRPALKAFALTVDTSALTAIGNDYGFESLFSRQIEAVGREGDVVFGISTSGSSPNVLRGLETARSMAMVTIGMTGNRRQEITSLADYVIEIPAGNTARIQEGHIVVGHIICGLVEKKLFPSEEK